MALYPIVCKQGFIDFSGERSYTQFPLGVINDATAGAVDAKAAAADLMHDALAVVTLCNMTTLHGNVILQADSGGTPASTFAQRELAIEIDLQGVDFGTKATMSYPGPDTNGLLQTNTDIIDLDSNIVFMPIKDAIENDVRISISNTLEEQVAVIRARLIGRPS